MQQAINLDINTLMKLDAHVFVLDHNLKFQLCNDRVADFWKLANINDIKGYSHKELTEQHDVVVDYQSFIQDDIDVLQSGMPKFNICEPPIKTDDGRVNFYRTNLLPIQNKNNDCIGVLGVSQCIQRERQQGLECINQTIELDSRYEQLTRREKVILQQLVTSHTTKHVANRLNLSNRTVESHINNIKRKLGHAGKAELLMAIINDS